jgi:hypothetical protein
MDNLEDLFEIGSTVAIAVEGALNARAIERYQVAD